MPRSHTDPKPPPRRNPLDPHGLDLRLVEQVIEVCRAGSFTDAARQLGISQPALSKSIAKFETQLGVNLFDRAGGNAQATPFAELIAKRGPSLLGSAAGLHREIALLARGDKGRLRIGAGPASRVRPLMKLAPRIVERFPALQLDIREEAGPALMRGLAEGRYDVAFSFYESAEPFGDFIRVKVLEDERIAVVRPGHPVLGSQTPLSPRDMLRFPLTSAGPTRGFRRWAGRMSSEEASHAMAMICEDFTIIAECAAASDYIGWGPRFAFEGALAQGRLVEVALDWPAKYACWMVTTEAHWRMPLIKDIAELAKSLGPATGGA